ncbi:hypothetical protein [Vannielia litorea]|uniref:Cellulose biosynthesis protein BcsS n=1 Tax=Vannielia litorea TaxID=1217970 RepID=A0A1N6HFS6_9RHOB|nr:hypothetical protein [Vannielia litorea]SIO18519.1 hypothetical protein SAMN05444002_3329 [Vannielia litorea]
MLRAIALALLLPLPALAQEAGGFRSVGLTLDGGGHPAGDYFGILAETRAVYPLGWAELGVDLTLSSAEADSRDLRTAGALLHLTARPAGWVAVGPYVWLGSQSEGRMATALGVEAAVRSPSGWGGELWFGETWGGVLGEEGYATNKGLRVSYDGAGALSGYAELMKDTVNLSAGDEDYYRLAFGVEAPVTVIGDREMTVSLATGQHHFDLLDERENWVSVGISIPLAPAGPRKPDFSSRRGVTHYLPMP